MNYKFYLALFLLITALILTGYFLISSNKTPFEDYKFTSPEITLLYQGPVQPDQDEDYFRQTGVTRSK